MLVSIIWHAVTFDQLNLYNWASMELVSRHILRIHRAVKRAPKSPSFDGLGVMVQSRLDYAGEDVVGDFATFIAEQQKAEAFTLKQQRLYADETATSTGKKDPKKKD